MSSKGIAAGALAPLVIFVKGGFPQLIGGGILVDVAFGCCVHIYEVDADAVGRVSKPGFQLSINKPVSGSCMQGIITLICPFIM